MINISESMDTKKWDFVTNDIFRSGALFDRVNDTSVQFLPWREGKMTLYICDRSEARPMFKPTYVPVVDINSGLEKPKGF